MLLSASTLRLQNAYALDLSKLGVNYFDTNAAPCKPQEDMLKACDVALESCKTANKSKDKVIEAISNINIEQNAQIKSLTESNNSILKNPIVWFVLGVLTTSLTIAIIK